LRGKPAIENPDRCVDDNWSIKPRDFVLYAVKYVNQWHGVYLRRGTDHITQLDGSQVNFVRHEQYVEDDDTVSISTVSLTKAALSLPLYSTDSTIIDVAHVMLTFTDDENCTIAGETNNFTVTGSGKFVPKGDKNSIGGTDRDALYLNYTVKYKLFSLKFETSDTLVVRDRGVAPEYFSVVRK